MDVSGQPHASAALPPEQDLRTKYSPHHHVNTFKKSDRVVTCDTGPSSAEIKECVALYLHSSIRLHGVVLI